MNNKIGLAIASLAFVGGTVSSGVVLAGDKEKCYGVAKAGKNDCATKTSVCAGHSTSDGQKDTYIVVPKGLCSRLVGSSKESS
jgi:uncharacterized membrane protein